MEVLAYLCLYAISGRGNERIQMFISTFSAIYDTKENVIHSPVTISSQPF